MENTDNPKTKSKDKNKDLKIDDDNIKINYHILEDNKEINPFLGVFPFNYPNIDMLNNPTETEWKIGKNKRNDKTILGINSKITYSSGNKPESMESRRSEFVLGLINRKRPREIDIYDIDSIFNINQKIKKVEKEENIIRKAKLILSENGEIKEDNEGVDKNEMLAQMGIAKAKRSAMNMKENKLNANNISSKNAVKQIYKKAANEPENKVSEEEQKEAQLSRYKDILPKFNLNTKDVSDVFEYNSIIENEKVKEIDHKDVLKMLKKEGKGLEENKKLFCDFVYHYLKSLVPKINEGKNLSNKIKYSIYVNELVKFYHLPRTIREKSDKLASRFTLGEDYVNEMLSKYTNKSVDPNSGFPLYTKNQNLIVRIIFHIICLCLLLNYYEFDYTTLSSSLKIENKKMMEYLRQIGCSFRTSAATGNTEKNNIVKFTAPLKLDLKQKGAHLRK